MSRAEAYLQALDASWRWPRAERVRLSILGSTALMIHSAYERGTKDCDVFETPRLDAETAVRLREIAGEGTPLARRHGAYIDVVRNGIPFLPHPPLWHPMTQMNRALRHLEIEVLDVVDVCVSKLKRGNANDRTDVIAMIERGLVPHERLLERFTSAFEGWGFHRDTRDLPRYVGNLNRVERDVYGVTPTAFEYPDD